MLDIELEFLARILRISERSVCHALLDRQPQLIASIPRDDPVPAPSFTV